MESKRNEGFLQGRISKAEQKLYDLQISNDELRMLTSGEEIKTQLGVTQRKMEDVKSDFASIDVIKMHYTKEVMFTVDTCMYVCMYVATYVLRYFPAPFQQ